MLQGGAMSTNSSTLSEESGLANFNPLLLQNTCVFTSSQPTQTCPKKLKKKRNQPGNPDPEAEVISLSPTSLLAKNRFVCEICNKGFQRDQNLQLHRRGHNLPWKLKQRDSKVISRKKVYVCPEKSCVHNHPSRALGDLTGIKKHYCRKHGEKKYKCEKCSKVYAVLSDWKAHSKVCGTREYKCDCGTLFSRKDSFITHRAFCDALAEETTKLSTNPFSPPPQPPLVAALPPPPPLNNPFSNLFPFSPPLSYEDHHHPQNPNTNPLFMHIKNEDHHFPLPSQFLSATALLQRAVSVGPVSGGADLLSAPPYQESQPHDVDHFTTMLGLASLASWGKDNEGFTRDFLGLTGPNDATSTATTGLQYDATTGLNDIDTASSLLLKSLGQNHTHHDRGAHEQERVRVGGFGNCVGGDQCEPPSDSFGL